MNGQLLHELGGHNEYQYSSEHFGVVCGFLNTLGHSETPWEWGGVFPCNILWCQMPLPLSWPSRAPISTSPSLLPEFKKEEGNGTEKKDEGKGIVGLEWQNGRDAPLQNLPSQLASYTNITVSHIHTLLSINYFVYTLKSAWRYKCPGEKCGKEIVYAEEYDNSNTLFWFM